MKRVLWSMLPIALVLILSGCVSNKAYLVQQNRIQALEARLDSQAATMEMARKDIIDSRQKIDELIIRLSGSGTAPAKVGRDDQLAELQTEVLALRKTLYSTADNLSSVSNAVSSSEANAIRQEIAQIRTENARLDRILDDLAEELKTLSDHKAPSTPKELASQDKSMSGIYQAALAEYNLGHYDKAITLFEELIKSFPLGELKPNAHYWIAESYYSKADYSKALRQFESTATLYPDHRKGIDALMKVGVTYYKLDDKVKARARLNSFKGKYPAYESMDMVDYYLDLVK